MALAPEQEQHRLRPHMTGNYLISSPFHNAVPAYVAGCMDTSDSGAALETGSVDRGLRLHHSLSLYISCISPHLKCVAIDARDG